MNGLKTAVLLSALTGIIMLIGNYFGGQQGMVMAFGIAAVMNFVSYWFSDKIVLAMYHAKPIEREQAPELYDLVNDLATRLNMPMPKLYIIPTESPNAFATGRNPQHAAVAVTQGILRLLSWDELRGVIGHELSHVTNRDILISSIAATLAGAIMMLARMVQFGLMFGGYGNRDRDRGGNPLGLLIMAILAPFAAMLIQMAISRSREYQADESGAKLVGDPRGLASALQKIQAASQQIPMRNANPAGEHLFIIKPFTGQALTQLFSTHPPTEKRIERLHQIFGRF